MGPHGAHRGCLMLGGEMSGREARGLGAAALLGPVGFSKQGSPASQGGWGADSMPGLGACHPHVSGAPQRALYH